MVGIFTGPGTIRPSQIISTFGPGSIYDNLRDSFLIMGINSWDRSNLKKVSDPVLLSFLKNEYSYFANIKTFMVPVSTEVTDKQVPVKTFPRWGVCPECSMIQLRNGKMHGGLRCSSNECTTRSRSDRTLTPYTRPVRFVVACENGHLDDFPWYEWAHDGNPGNCGRNDARLHLVERGDTSSLESLVVECRNCDRRKNMGGSLAPEGLSLIGRRHCNGRRPWLEGSSNQTCTATQRGMLKGASNVYFPSPIRAVSVPPFSDQLSNDIVEMWDAMAKIKDEKRLLDNIKDWFPDYDPQMVLEKFERHKTARNRTDTPDIFSDEFRELNSGYIINDVDFKTEPIDVTDYIDYLDKLILVKTIKELVVLRGFSRINPDGPTASISTEIPEWLPAVENRGEGIFLSLNEKKLSEWEKNPKVEKRMKLILEDTQDDFVDRVIGSRSAMSPSARYVLLHTLSHLIIRKISDYAGYSVSSIRERVYGRKDMAGILLYTSSASSDGSLGGLIEQGQKNFGLVLRKAIDQSRICSSDPLCAVMEPGRENRRSGSACHACLFLPETSCECMNNFLDRSFIHSTLVSEMGYFGMG